MAGKRKKAGPRPGSLWYRVPLLYALTAFGALAGGHGLRQVWIHQSNGRLAMAATAAPSAAPAAGQSSVATAPLAAIPAEPQKDYPWNLFHPAWHRITAPSLLPVKNTEVQDRIEASGQTIAELVDDPRNRLAPDFKVPAPLRQRVTFWMQIYARFNSHMRVVHDRINPGIVYGYIDFRPLYRTAESNAAAERQAYKLEKTILQRLKARLREAVGIDQSHDLSPDEKAEIQTMLSQVGAFSAKDTMQLVSNIRTQSGQSDMFLLALYRSRNLLPHIESVFRQKGLPIELARVPFVESSFNARAASKGGAIGIWQFMPETARQMIRGDEEKAWADPLKQTQSAARIFAMYRSLLPDWGTTVTAYNSGVGRLQRLVKKHHAKDLSGLLNANDDDGLGFAGKNFYAEFEAANLVEAYKDELFKQWLEPADSSLVFRGLQPFPKTYCDM